MKKNVKILLGVVSVVTAGAVFGKVMHDKYTKAVKSIKDETQPLGMNKDMSGFGMGDRKFMGSVPPEFKCENVGFLDKLAIKMAEFKFAHENKSELDDTFFGDTDEDVKESWSDDGGDGDGIQSDDLPPFKVTEKENLTEDVNNYVKNPKEQVEEVDSFDSLVGDAMKEVQPKAVHNAQGVSIKSESTDVGGIKTEMPDTGDILASLEVPDEIPTIEYN